MSKYLIRVARLHDVGAMAALSEVYHSATVFPAIIPFDRHSVEATLRSIISEPMGVALVLECSEFGVVGMMTGKVCPAYWNAAALIGQQFLLFVLPGFRDGHYRELLGRFEAECRDRGACVVASAVPFGKRTLSMDRVLVGSGYFALEGVYVKEV